VHVAGQAAKQGLPCMCLHQTQGWLWSANSWLRTTVHPLLVGLEGLVELLAPPGAEAVRGVEGLSAPGLLAGVSSAGQG
jgi:hypothetical protein